MRLAVFGIGHQAFAGDLIGSQDFESPGWESEFTGQGSWGDNITRTTSNPHAGTQSLRWNQDATRVDPITGLQGIGNTVLDWRGGVNIVQQTPHEMYMSFYFRHDDYSNTSGDGGSRKLFYLVDAQYNVGAMYLRNQLGMQVPRISYANGAYPDTWARNNWGYSSMYLRNPNVSATLDGQWRRCQVYFNYDHHYMMVWFDGYLMLPVKHGSMLTYWNKYPEDAAAGRIRWDPNLTLHYKGIQFFYYDRNRDLEGEVDGNGYYSGIQIDDLEVWDGLPGGMPIDTKHPKPPTKLRTAE